MLTPKVKKDFQKYLIKKGLSAEPVTISGQTVSFDFYSLPIAAQFGVYQDYFWQRHKIWPFIKPSSDNFNVKILMLNDNKRLVVHLINHNIVMTLKTDDQARKTAITEASKLAEKTL